MHCAQRPNAMHPERQQTDGLGPRVAPMPEQRACARSIPVKPAPSRAACSPWQTDEPIPPPTRQANQRTADNWIFRSPLEIWGLN